MVRSLWLVQRSVNKTILHHSPDLSLLSSVIDEESSTPHWPSVPNGNTTLTEARLHSVGRTWRSTTALNTHFLYIKWNRLLYYTPHNELQMKFEKTIQR